MRAEMLTRDYALHAYAVAAANSTLTTANEKEKEELG